MSHFTAHPQEKLWVRRGGGLRAGLLTFRRRLRKQTYQLYIVFVAIAVVAIATACVG